MSPAVATALTRAIQRSPAAELVHKIQQQKKQDRFVRLTQRMQMQRPDVYRRLMESDPHDLADLAAKLRELQESRQRSIRPFAKPSPYLKWLQAEQRRYAAKAASTRPAGCGRRRVRPSPQPRESRRPCNTRRGSTRGATTRSASRGGDSGDDGPGSSEGDPDAHVNVWDSGPSSPGIRRTPVHVGRAAR